MSTDFLLRPAAYRRTGIQRHEESILTTGITAPHSFGHVIWIGGGCGAGKSTVARALADRFDLQLYAVDAYSYAHEDRAAAGGYPVMRELSMMDYEHRWVQPDAAEQCDRFVRYSAERFAMVLDDLAAMPTTSLIVAEGPGLLPSLVLDHLASSRHALWMLPSTEFTRRSRVARGAAGPAERATVEAVLRRTIERDHLLTTATRRILSEHDLAGLEVDGARSLAATEELVIEHFAPILAARPRPTGADRQRFRRAENLAVYRNIRAYLAWLGPAQGPAAPPFEFSCECAGPGCRARVPLTVSEYGALLGDGTLAVASTHAAA
jgi:hypothetical protein